MKPYIFVAKPLPASFEDMLKEHCTYEVWQSKDPIPRDLLFEKLQKADGLLTSGTKIDQDLLDHAPQLKVVSNNSVGYDNFDLEAMRQRGVIGTHTPYTLDHTVADLAFSLILSSARRIASLIVLSARENGQNLFKKKIYSALTSIIKRLGSLGWDESVSK